MGFLFYFKYQLQLDKEKRAKLVENVENTQRYERQGLHSDCFV